MMRTFPITVVRATSGSSVDEQGNPVETFSESLIDGWIFSPGTPSEQPDRVDVSGTLFGPLEADVKSTDLVRFDGNTYSVVGEPEFWEAAFGSVSGGCRVLVKRRG